MKNWYKAIGAAGSGGYKIKQSIYTNGDAYLQHTIGSSSDRRTWSWSGWVKIVDPPSTSHQLFSGVLNENNRTGVSLTSAGAFEYLDWNGGSQRARLTSATEYRDFSGWVNFMVGVDTTQATGSDRIKLYVNGNELTDFSTTDYGGQNNDTHVNNASSVHHLGAQIKTFDAFSDVYFAECHFVEGFQLTPDSFGKIDALTGEWVPIPYTGTYGTNGVYLDFSNPSDPGADAAGTNDYTNNNFATTDVVSDSPTNNYATLNPLDGTTLASYSEGNLRTTITSSNYGDCLSTFAMQSGKWYAEFEVISLGGSSNTLQLGVAAAQLYEFDNTNHNGITTGVTMINTNNSDTAFQEVYIDGTKQDVVASIGAAASDVFGIAFDADNEEVYFYKNGTEIGTGPYSVTNLYSQGSQIYRFAIFIRLSDVVQANFGQRAFDYTPPTGYKSLCTNNLPAPGLPNPRKAFGTVLWTGDGNTSIDVTGLQFEPYFIWSKLRSQGQQWVLVDQSRGGDRVSDTSSAVAEYTATDYGEITSWNSDGFTATKGTQVESFYNKSSATYLAWCWGKGTYTASNTDGDITSATMAYPELGFSVVTYTGNQTDNQDVGHGLGIKPNAVMFHPRETDNTSFWRFDSYDGSMDFVNTNSDAAVGNDGSGLNSFTSTTFPVRSGLGDNGDGNGIVAYVFANVEGACRIEIYTGNGSTDGPFVYCGFRPAWVLIKRLSATNFWVAHDNVRDGDPDNPVDYRIYPNSNLTEAGAGGFPVDYYASGFKIRNTSTIWNADGSKYLFIAVADSPLKYARGR